jgi:hypothetical protein
MAAKNDPSRVPHQGQGSGMIPLTGKQRYWQAVRKARIEAARDMRKFLAGKVTSTGRPTMDRERDYIIAEIERLQARLEAMNA